MAVKTKGGGIEVACQQVLLQDASVYSVQWLVVPERVAHLVTTQLLLDRYLKLVRDFTFSMARPLVSADGIEFRLFSSSLAFLSFAPPEHVSGQGTAAVLLRINGGFLVQARERGRGMLSLLTEQDEGGLRITVQLSYCGPLLLGKGPPSRLRRLLYRVTQGALHKAVTIRFLSDLYRELTGEKIQVSVKKVRVKDGMDI
jgi:hypothetical protein